MGPEAEVPSASASEEEPSEAVLVEVELSEPEASLVEEPLSLPQPASIEAHSISANIVERTFFMVITFLLDFFSCPFSLPFGIHDKQPM